MAKKRLPKQPKPEPRTLTVRANTVEQIKALDNLMAFTGAKTVTGAIFAAGTQLPVLKSNLESLQAQVNALEKIKREQHELIHFMHSGQKQLEAYGKKFLKDAGKYPEPEFEFNTDK